MKFQCGVSICSGPELVTLCIEKKDGSIFAIESKREWSRSPFLSGIIEKDDLLKLKKIIDDEVTEIEQMNNVELKLKFDESGIDLSLTGKIGVFSCTLYSHPLQSNGGFLSKDNLISMKQFIEKELENISEDF